MIRLVGLYLIKMRIDIVSSTYFFVISHCFYLFICFFEQKKLKLTNIQLSTAKKKKPMLFRNVGPRVDSGLKQSKTMHSPQLKQYARPKSSPPKLSSSEDSSCILSPASIQEVDQVSF